MSHLSDFAKNKYSQFGEDGIISEILDRLSVHTRLDKWCVEFGAWDGVHLSNTCALIRDRNYNAVLIEGDEARVESLNKNHPQETVFKIHKMVGLEGENTLDQILSSTNIPKNFDLLSIDIDGCDYWILESLDIFKPKVLVIEYNPTIPNSIEYIQEADFGVRRGCSALSLKLLANLKGFELVAATKTNLIFVDKKYSESVLPGVGEMHIDDIRDDSPWKNYIFSGYDGTIFTSKPIHLPWHDVTVDSSHIQVIPRVFRIFPEDINPLKKKTWFLFRRIFSSKFKN